ncbi:MAG TPA: MaoC family dehydratase [Burkholderiaceae bacterium]|nr:MaoC family dehydratase [Burkholderiaceae bacterium]
MEIRDRLVQAGEKLTHTVRYTRDEIASFARSSFDHNPLHVDATAAQRGRFGEIIASGQQTAAVLMGMLATHFSRHDDGVRREMLCLNMNFAFKGPIFAEQSVALMWKVAKIEWNNKLGGWIAHLDGHAGVAGAHPALVARGTILVTEAAAA